MADPCFKLSADINTSCDAQTNLTAEVEGLLINYPEILTKTTNATTKTICENLVLTAGASITAYKVFIRGLKPFDGTKVTGTTQAYGTAYDQDTKLVLYGNTPDNAAVVKIFAGGRFLLIYKQASQVGTSAYRVILGYEGGLHAEAPALDIYGADGGWAVPMKATMQSSPLMFLWAGTENATAIIEAALLV